MRAKLGAVALVIAAIAGPISVVAAEPPLQVSGDRFSKDITFLGPMAAVNPFGGTFRSWRIRSFLNREAKTVTHQLYVEVEYAGDWRWYGLAADDSAQDLAVVKIASHVGSCRGGCSLSETVGVDLPDALLRAHSTNGLQIKLTAQSGDSLILALTPEMISSQLQAINGYAGQASGSPSSPIPAPPPPFGVDATSAGGFSRAMLKIQGGAVVGWVQRNSVAARAGVHWADVIVSWDGSPVTGADDLQAKLKTVTAGQKVGLRVIRGRQPIDLDAQF